jgi:uncharacterized membrane protein
MESLLILVLVGLVLAAIIFPIWVFSRISDLTRSVNRLRLEVEDLQIQARSLRQFQDKAAASAKPAGPELPLPARPVAAPVVVSDAPPVLPTPAVSAPVAPAPVASTPAPAPRPAITPAPLPEPPLAAPPAPEPVFSLPKVNWEQFMGAKLFAWLGGLALFLGVAFFVKYSFEHNLIPPEVRVALGFLLGLGLIVGGLRLARSRYLVTSQTLVASGTVSLYAVTFACNSIYHFAFFGPTASFLLMSLITATAFILAVRLEAPVVAVLGMLGGFLTPILLSTGQDNPAGLFGYLALLDLGLLAVALHRRWNYLVPLGAAGTVLMQVGWTDKFFTAAKAPVAVVVVLAFCALFLAAYAVARRLGRGSRALTWTTAALPGTAFLFALHFLDYPAVVARPGLLFLHVFLADAVLLALAWLEEDLPKLHLAGGAAVFLLLALWTGIALTDTLLPWALAGYLVFAGMHTAFPLLLERRRPATAPTWWSQLFPPLTLLLMLFPIFRLTTVSLLIWPAILLVDLAALGLAWLSASLAAVAAVLVLTLLATGLCLFRIPADTLLEPSLLLIIGGFAVFFFGASLWLVRKLGDSLAAGQDGDPARNIVGDSRAQLPAFAALLPFLLLIMASLHLRVPDPSAVFGLGLLLVILVLGLARLLAIEWLPACALAGIAALELVWFQEHFHPDSAGLALAWVLGFQAIFACYPFLFRREFARMTGPWAVAALGGVAHFWMVYRAIRLAWPNEFLGVVPALYALPPLASLFARLRQEPADNPHRLNQLAWFGGVALFFITLIFPIQFERQWLTLGWALEGVALLWLFHRVPHPGLRGVGTGLLLAAFARLALNPAVFGYHVRGDTALLNWYLYAYGLALACLFAGARLYQPKDARVFGVTVPPLLAALGTVLAFLLLNIEIADFFTAPGTRALAFTFSGNFGRDMTYTIAWALFALGLLGAGLWRHARPARYAAIGLLTVALLKLFFHDLARLEALYRIGALFAVAVIAILASVAYQRFQPSNDPAPPRQP